MRKSKTLSVNPISCKCKGNEKADFLAKNTTTLQIFMEAKSQKRIAKKF